MPNANQSKPFTERAQALIAVLALSLWHGLGAPCGRMSASARPTAQAPNVALHAMWPIALGHEEPRCHPDVADTSVACRYLSILGANRWSAREFGAVLKRGVYCAGENQHHEDGGETLMSGGVAAPAARLASRPEKASVITTRRRHWTGPARPLTP